MAKDVRQNASRVHVVFRSDLRRGTA